MTFDDQIISFNESLHLEESLPERIRVMNPFRETGGLVTGITRQFYHRYYHDQRKRYLILAINPGRFGAGATGIPFTDTKHLKEICGIDAGMESTHEPSSVFVYDMIKAYGGPEKFYSDFYITSVCPLGFVRLNDHGKEVNFNYYDSKKLEKAVLPFIIRNLQAQLRFNINTQTCICWGKGKNHQFLQKLNKEYFFFKEIEVLEHPRYIMQYRAKQKSAFIEKYLEVFKKIIFLQTGMCKQNHC